MDPQKITEDLETLEEAYERQRFESLPPDWQRLVWLHAIDQLEAVPSYVEEQARAFASEPD